jgi:hypothetical protein
VFELDVKPEDYLEAPMRKEQTGPLAPFWEALSGIGIPVTESIDLALAAVWRALSGEGRAALERVLDHLKVAALNLPAARDDDEDEGDPWARFGRPKRRRTGQQSAFARPRETTSPTAAGYSIPAQRGSLPLAHGGEEQVNQQVLYKLTRGRAGTPPPDDAA